MAGTKRGIYMPRDISRDPVQREIWKSIVSGNTSFTVNDVPSLRLLCYWHAVAKEVRESIAKSDGHIDILDPVGTKPHSAEPMLRKNPALTVLKDATAEIRALSDQLGISPRSRTVQTKQQRSSNSRLLNLVIADREAKARRAGA